MTMEELKKRKKELGLSNREVSEVSGIPLGTVNKIFSGQTTAPRYQTLLAISRALSLAARSQDSGLPEEPGHAYPLPADTGQSVAESSAPYVIPEAKDKKYTIKDYLSFPDDHRCELIDGVIYDMSSPTTIHQYIVSAIRDTLSHFIRSGNGSCIPFVSPVDVQPDPDDDRTIIQPDVIVVCDRKKITPARIIGAPDLVIEILSPSTRKKDIGVKTNVYERSGVREYWLVDPDRENVVVYRFGDEYTIQLYGFSAKVPVGIFGDECQVDFAEIAREYAFILNQ